MDLFFQFLILKPQIAYDRVVLHKLTKLTNYKNQIIHAFFLF